MLAWGYPLSVLCRRAGKPPAAGWLAGTVRREDATTA
jgi:hypothetical protein